MIRKCYVLLTVNLITVFVINQLGAQFFFLYLFIQILYMFRATKCSLSGELNLNFFFLYFFIPILYKFRATKCSSSGESVVSIRPLVYVTLCR